MDIGSLRVKLGVDTRQLSTAQAKMQKFGTESTTVFQKVRKAVFSLQGALVGLGGGLVVRQVLSAAKDYQSALVDMGKVTNQAFSEIDASIKGMDSSLGNATDLMRGYYQVISAGVTEPKAALETLTTASKLANVAHMSQADTVRALTKIMAGYGDAITSTEDAADLLIKTEKLGQTSVAELVPVIGDVANISNMAGLRAEEMAGALALITQTAGSTAEATTQLKALMRSVIKPTEEMTAIFSEFGSASEALQQLGLVEWLRRVEKAAGGAEGAAKMLGGRQESLIAFSALLRDEFSALAGNIDELKDRTGTLAGAWERYRESLEAIINETKANLVNLMTNLGEKVLPSVSKSLQVVNEHFDMLVTTIATLIKFGLALKIAGWITALGKLTVAVSTANKSFIGFKVLLSGIAAGPLGIGIAITGLIYLLEKFYTASEKVKESVRDTYSVLGTGGGLLKDLPTSGDYDETEWRNKQLEVLQEQKKAAEEARKAVEAQARAQTKMNLSDVSEEFRKITETASAFEDELKKIGKTAQELELIRIDETFEKAREAIGGATPEMIAWREAAIKDVLGPTQQQAFTETFSTFAKSVHAMAGQAKNAMKELGVSATEAGATLSTALIQKAETAANYLVDEFDNPFMRTMFIDALEKLGAEGGGALYQAIADELKGVNDLVQGAADATVEAKKKAEDIQLGFTPYTPEHTDHVSGTQRLMDERRAEEMNQMMALEESRKLKEKLDLMKQERFIELNPQAAGMFGGNEQGNQIGQSMGESIGQSMQDPITEAFQNVVSNMGSLDFTPVADSMRTSMEGLSNEGQGVGDNIGQKINQGLVTQIKDAVEKAKSEINGLATRVTIDIKAQVGSVSDEMRGDM